MSFWNRAIEEEKGNPELVGSLTNFMQLGCPDGSLAYLDLDPEHAVFVQGYEFLTVGDIRNIQRYLRLVGFEGGKGRTEVLMSEMPSAGTS